MWDMCITPLYKRTRVNIVLNKGGSSAVCPFTSKISLPVQNETFPGGGIDWAKACLLQKDSKYRTRTNRTNYYEHTMIWALAFAYQLMSLQNTLNAE
jgi:hypothetical protein